MSVDKNKIRKNCGIMNEWEKSSQDFPADWWYQKILYIQLKKIKFGQIDITSKDCYKEKQVGS